LTDAILTNMGLDVGEVGSMLWVLMRENVALYLQVVRPRFYSHFWDFVGKWLQLRRLIEGRRVGHLVTGEGRLAAKGVSPLSDVLLPNGCIHRGVVGRKGQDNEIGGDLILENG
jgi:hypothetical protein